jgi:hypothetical protein
MRSLRTSLTVLAAALYVLLGISASWHAPHFSRGDAAIGVDQHGGHEVVLDGASCALCSAQKSAQEFFAASGIAPWSRTGGQAPVLRDVTVVRTATSVLRARAPPSLS